MASPVKQRVQLSLFITGGDYGEGNVRQDSTNRRHIPQETCLLQLWKDPLKHQTRSQVSSSSPKKNLWTSGVSVEAESGSLSLCVRVC